MKSNIEQNNYTIKLNQQSIKSLQEQLNSNSLSDSQRAQIKQAIVDLGLQIKNLDEANKIMYADLESQKFTNADAIRSLNDLIYSNKTIENNEKIVNEIYLAALIRDNGNFSEEQTSQLLSIASQCAISGGPAVFKARSLFSLIDESITFNDKDICYAQGIILKHKKEVSNFMVYPNPTTGKIRVDYNVSSINPGLIEIYDGVGRKVRSIKLLPENHEEELDLSDLMEGLYTYRFIFDQSVIDNGQISLIR